MTKKQHIKINFNQAKYSLSFKQLSYFYNVNKLKTSLV